MTKEFDEAQENLLELSESESYASFNVQARAFVNNYPTNYIGWILYANSLWNLAQFNEAHKALLNAKCHIEEKHLFHLYLQFGNYYTEKHNLRSAEIWYKKSIKAKKTASVLIHLGACFAKQGKYAEAKKEYHRSIKFSSELEDEAYLNLGYIARAEAEYEIAVQYFEKAIAIDPEYTEAIDAHKDVTEVLKYLK